MTTQLFGRIEAKRLISHFPRAFSLEQCPCMAMALAATRKARRASHSLRRQAPAAGLGAVILVLLGLHSANSHMACKLLPGCEMWDGTAMAIGLGLLIVGLEVARSPRQAPRLIGPSRFANRTIPRLHVERGFERVRR
jgi:hypothetical protein